MQTLSPRQESILNRVIDTHIETAEPVGSQFITGLYTQLYQGSYSPATVRHEMGLLEEMGYLTHPHTSAGRIPTDLGYRYYVDHGLRCETFPRHFFEDAETGLRNAAGETQNFAEEASAVLSGLSDEASLLLSPVEDSRNLKGGKRARLWVQGMSHFLEKPEFQDVKTVGRFLKAFDDRNQIAVWLTAQTSEEGVSISIGRENRSEIFQDCSVVSIRYRSGGRPVGILAVIGPTRMRYSRLLPLLKEMAGLVERILD